MLERGRGLIFIVNFLSLENYEKKPWIVSRDGVFLPTSNLRSGLGFTSANSGDICCANRPALPRRASDEVKSASTKGSSRAIFRYLLRSVGALPCQR
jgi:hypothetical protein